MLSPQEVSMSIRSHKVPRNDPCPCGSGRKHKNCCWGRDVDWRREEDGSDVRHTTIPAELATAMRENFVETKGREPEPSDLLVPDFDPIQHSIDLPRLLTESNVGSDEQKYASMVTGLIPAEGRLTGADEDQYVEAMQAWRNLGEEKRAAWRGHWAEPVGSSPPEGFAELLGEWELPSRKARFFVSGEDGTSGE